MKDVTIAIKGMQEVDGEENVIEMITDGTLSMTDGECLLEYDEKDEDNQVTHTQVSVENADVVTIQRDGPQGNRMTIQRGQRHLCHYDTPFGSLLIGVFGEHVTADLGEGGGEIRLRYTIDINAAMQSRNEVQISIKELKPPCLN